MNEWNKSSNRSIFLSDSAKTDIDLSGNVLESNLLSPLEKEPSSKKQNTRNSLAYFLIGSDNEILVTGEVHMKIASNDKLMRVVDAIKEIPSNEKYAEYDFEIHANAGPSSELEDVFLNDGDVDSVLERVKNSALLSAKLYPLISLETLIHKRSLGSIGNPLFIKMPDYIVRTLPVFNPANYKISFPFFDSNGESYLTMFGRDDVVEKINSSLGNTQKYEPIIISTSRGMGKTFLMKMIGLQKVGNSVKNQKIMDAGKCGRILSFDFAKNAKAITTVDDAMTFPCRLMIYFLCMLFKGTQVDGIEFEEILNFNHVNVTYVGKANNFNSWMGRYLGANTEKMIDEYIRLTNIVFRVDPNSSCYTAPPVFLFDEVQCLTLEPTNVESKLSGSKPRYHTFLSLLLTEFACKHRPLSISAGTNDGSILDICNFSAFYPKVLSLTPLMDKSILERNDR